MWLDYTALQKKAIYRAFTAQQRIDFWKAKLEETEKLNWNEKELKHIQKIAEFIDLHSEYFEGGLSIDEEDVLDEFFYKWQAYAIDSLGWSKKLIYAIAATGERLQDKSGNIVQLGEKATIGVDRVVECDCSVKYDFCGVTGTSTCKESGSCTESDYGCGWIWLNDCTGLCDF